MSSRRERAQARGRRRRRRLAVAHVVSVAVHVLPLVALVGFDWPDLEAEPEVPMRRLVDVRLEQRRPPKDVMFQAAHDADPEKATTAVANGRAAKAAAETKAAAVRPPAARRRTPARPVPRAVGKALGRSAAPGRRRPKVERTLADGLTPGVRHPERPTAPHPAIVVPDEAALTPAAPGESPPPPPVPGEAGAQPADLGTDTGDASDDLAVAEATEAPAAPSPVAAPAAQVPELRPALTTELPARAMLLAAYLRRIREKIRRQWHPHVVLGSRGPGTVWQSVEVQVYMAIRSDGSLETVRLAHSCGDKRLDGAALVAVRRAQPFLPPPAALLQGGVVGFTFGALAFGPGGAPR